MEMQSRGKVHRPFQDASLMCASVGADGAAIAVWSVRSDPGAWVVTRQDTYIIQRIRCPAIEGWNNLFAQPMPGGKVLIANARHVENEPGERVNAALFSGGGSELIRADLGHGIEHLLTTSEGEVWVGYFDEGVFADDDPNGSAPVSASGLARFDGDLNRAWAYEPDSRHPPIFDCYALNVGKDAVHAYAYEAFAVLRVTSNDTSSFTTDVEGARALVVSGDRCVLVGNYDDASLVADGTLSRGGLQRAHSSRLTHDGTSLGKRSTMVARGSELHLFRGVDWYHLTL